jgi:hypothetical protein
MQSSRRQTVQRMSCSLNTTNEPYMEIDKRVERHLTSHVYLLLLLLGMIITIFIVVKVIINDKAVSE